MKLYVKAIVKKSNLTWPSSNYIYHYRDFEIDCKICDRKLKVFKDTYKLCLEGTEDKIKSFISYLRMEGFNVEQY